MEDDHDSRYEALKEVHSGIHRCQLCVGLPNGTIQPDPKKVVRKTVARTLDSDVFVVGQSLAATQVRMTGVPFHGLPKDVGSSSLTISGAGRFLDRFFRTIGYTLDPLDNDRKYVYTTDLVQCFPGRKPSGKGDRTPKAREIENCRPWFLKELRIIRPKVILLLGTPATRAFFRQELHQRVRSSRELYGKTTKYPAANGALDATLDTESISVFVLPHPASMVKDKNLIYERSFAEIAKRLAT